MSTNRPNPIDNVLTVVPGFLVCAEPYPCQIKPRSEARRATILREFEEAKAEVFSQYETPKDQMY